MNERNLKKSKGRNRLVVKGRKREQYFGYSKVDERKMTQRKRREGKRTRMKGRKGRCEG